jgi:hypothetical protein
MAVGVPDPDLAELLLDDLSRQEPQLLRVGRRFGSESPTERLPGPE